MTTTRRPDRVRLSRTNLHQQQYELWQKARDGCQQSANELAKSLAPWVYDKSRKLVSKWGADTIDADDVAAVGMAKILIAIRKYDGSGTFSGYFFVIASRTMCEYCANAAVQHTRFRSIADDVLDTHATTHDDHDTANAVDHTRLVTDALFTLTKLERKVFTARTGYRQPKQSIATVARRLKVTEQKAEAIYTAAYNRVSDYLVTHSPTPQRIRRNTL